MYNHPTPFSSFVLPTERAGEATNANATHANGISAFDDLSSHSNDAACGAQVSTHLLEHQNWKTDLEYYV